MLVELRRPRRSISPPVRHILSTRVGRATAVPAGAVTAALTVALQAADAPGWIVASTWLAAFVLVVVVFVARSVRWWPGAEVAEQMMARVLLMITAVDATSDRAPEHQGLLWLVGAAVLASILIEPAIRRLGPLRDVANLPGFEMDRWARPIGWLGPVSVVVLALTAAFALTSVPLPVRLLPLLVQAGVSAVAVVGAVRARRDRPARTVRLRASLEAYAPAFAVYTGREDGGAYQVEMWLPYLERLARPYIVITRVPSALAALARATSVPVVARASWRELDDAVVPSLRAAFYVNSAATNTNFIGYRQLTHVYLGHGESDKSLSFHPSHAMFDRVFVAGQAAIDRYARNGVLMRPDAFVIVGRPQLDGIRPAAGGRPVVSTVLYAPTWAGYNAETSYSSLPFGVVLARALLARGVVVIFRPHPFSRTRPGERRWVSAVDAVLRADAATTGRSHRWGPEVDQSSFADSAERCDAMISDLSSVVVDFLASGKPAAIMSTAGATTVGATAATPDADFVSRYPVARGCYVIRGDLGNLDEVLTAMLSDDPRRADRERTRDYYLGGLSGPEAAAAFTAAAAACLTPRTSPAHE